MYTSNINNIRYLGELYESGEVKIDEDSKTISITQLNKSFFGSKLVFVGRVDYTQSSVVNSDGLEVRIDSLAFTAESKHVVDTIIEIVTRPRRAERFRKENMISLADASILNFLLERANTMKDLGMLKSNPREAIMKLETVGEGEDPQVLIKRKLTEALRSPFASMEPELSNLKTIVTDAKMQRVYALIYGIAAVQTSMLLRTDAVKPLGLLEKVAAKKLNTESLSGLSLTDATKRIHSEASIMNPSTLLD